MMEVAVEVVAEFKTSPTREKGGGPLVSAQTDVQTWNDPRVKQFEVEQWKGVSEGRKRH